MTNDTSFYTVGELKNLLDGLPDTQRIFCQVAAVDGSAWNMFGAMTSNNEQSFTTLTFSHPQLKTMPKIEGE